MYKPWIFYHLGPTFFVWSWTQATWLPKTRSSGKMRLLNFSHYDQKLGTSHTRVWDGLVPSLDLTHISHVPNVLQKIHQKISDRNSSLSITVQHNLAGKRLQASNLSPLIFADWGDSDESIVCCLMFIHVSLQPLGLPAANPAYPLTCQIPSQGLSFSFSKTP